MPTKSPAPSRTALTKELSALRAENDALRCIAQDLHWMARRYANGRQSYVTSLFNDHTRTLLKLGVKLNPTNDGTIWARDAGGRAYDGLTDEEAAMGQRIGFFNIPSDSAYTNRPHPPLFPDSTSKMDGNLNGSSS